MFTIKTIKGKEVEFENVADPKNQQLDISAIANKIKMLETEYKLYLANLNVLAEAVDVEKKAADAKKLRDQVNEMTGEQLAALKEAIEAKEKQN